MQDLQGLPYQMRELTNYEVTRHGLGTHLWDIRADDFTPKDARVRVFLGFSNKLIYQAESRCTQSCIWSYSILYACIDSVVQFKNFQGIS